MEAPVVNAENTKIGSRELSPEFFGVEVNDALLWEIVRYQLAKRRVGTHDTLERGEVAGSNKKPWKQKGSGRARAGEKRSPVWRGGGIVFGPHPRCYAYSMPKKKRKLAIKSALSAKLRDNELIVVDSLGLNEVKTSKMVKVLGALGAANALVVIPAADEVIEKSARNIPTVKVLRSEGLNVYDMLRYDKLVLVGSALEKIQEGL